MDYKLSSKIKTSGVPKMLSRLYLIFYLHLLQVESDGKLNIEK